ncbi:MAG: hypothetical protein IPK19_25465 [Chloroflexi bacterium]|nr:hypothetical protein [Chloroflexota bacterium]
MMSATMHGARLTYKRVIISRGKTAKPTINSGGDNLVWWLKAVLNPGAQTMEVAQCVAKISWKIGHGQTGRCRGQCDWISGQLIIAQGSSLAEDDFPEIPGVVGRIGEGTLLASGSNDGTISLWGIPG